MEREYLWVRKKDDVYLKVEANTGILRELSEFFKFKVPNCQYHPKFKVKMWDGYIRLFNLGDGSLYLGLWPYLEKFCKDRDYECIIDKEVKGDIPEITKKEVEEFYQTLNLPFSKPHQHQIDGTHFALQNSRGLIISPTASGKSLMIYSLVRFYEKKTLIIVTSLGLVTQMWSDFRDYAQKDPSFNVDKNIHTIFEGQDKNTKKWVTIATWQSIYKMPKSWFEQYDVIIGDEVHQFKANCLKSIMTNSTTTKFRFGFTGSLDGTLTNQLVLEGLFGTMFRTAWTKDLMDKKLLSDLKINCVCLKYSEREAQIVKRFKYQDEIKYIINHERRNIFVRNLAISMKDNTLILFQFIKHGKKLFEMIEKKLKETDPNRKVFFVAGETEKDAREQIRKLAETEKNAIIVASIGVFAVGVNIKNLYNIIFPSPTKARIRILQSIGRSLRIGDRGTTATLYDIVDDFTHKKYKNFAIKHFLERMKIYVSEKFIYKILKVNLPDK